MPDASLSVVSASAIPIYRQIVDQMRLYIENGTLAPGSPLPSVRSVATQLGVHFNTIAEAYRELAEEGWIELNQGKRAMVRPANSSRKLPSKQADGLRLRLRHLVAEMRLKGIAPDAIQYEVNAVLER